MTTMLMRKAAVGLMVACVGLATSLAGAQEAGSRPTREFAQAAASSDQFEISAATAALTQSTNADIRGFAARMLQDHQQLAQALRQAAMQSGLKPPEMAMSGDQAQMLESLQGLKGTEFDMLYLKQQVLAHRSALTVEQMYAKSGDDPNLRQSAASAVPLIGSHGDMASQMAAKLGVR